MSARARTAIRHHLKHLQHEDAVDFGHRMLDRALDARGSARRDSVRGARPLSRRREYKRLEELLADIALGNRMPDEVAGQLAETHGTAPHAQAECARRRRS